MVAVNQETGQLRIVNYPRSSVWMKLEQRPADQIGADNIVIKCIWLLIEHNALNVQSFKCVWLIYPSIEPQ